MTEVRSATGELVPSTFPQRGGLESLNALIGTRWNWWFPQSSPVVDFKCDLLKRNPPGGLRGLIRYADWLKASNECGKPGVYVWLIPRPSNRRRMRFVHVGRTTGSMLVRTREHCCNQFRPKGRNEWCTTDHVYKLPIEKYAGDDFGTLGEPLWAGGEIDNGNVQARVEAAVEFLKQVRIVYLTPNNGNQDCAKAQIKWMEAVIGVGAAQLLDPYPGRESGSSRETTNTFTGEMRTLQENAQPLQPGELAAIAKWLNAIEDMLPESPRNI